MVLSKKSGYHSAQKKTARELALRLLKEVEEKESYINLALNRMLSKISLEGEERSFLTELTYGVVQRRNTLDWVISRYSRRPLEEMTAWIRNILRMGAYQLLYMERVPDSAAVDEAVKLSHRYGHKGVSGLVNAVLRKISYERENIPWPSRDTDPARYLSLYYSYPLWMVERWIDNLGLEECEALCAAGNIPPPLTVRANTLKLDREELKKELLADGASVKECRYAPQGLQLRHQGRLIDLESFRKGHFQIQGEASMLVPPLLNPQPEESVLDLCAAPGGKTVHMAALMQNRGTIVAADLYQHRLRLIEAAARRQGAAIIGTEKIDGRCMPADRVGFFDRVLLDTPCSGLGVIRRKGDLKWRRRPEDIESLSQLQLDLLRGAFFALKEGGVMLYSACSVEPEETVQVMEKFLRQEPLARLSALSPFLPESFKDEEKEEGMLYLWPHRHGLDGFFLCRILKKGTRPAI